VKEDEEKEVKKEKRKRLRSCERECIRSKCSEEAKKGCDVMMSSL